VATKLPISRLFAEGVVVVASILLAFAIQAWWEGRGDRERETQALTALLAELDANAGVLDRNRAYFEGQVARAQALLAMSVDGTLGVPSDSVDALLAGVSGWSVPAYEQAALDAALQGGVLDVLESVALRQAIAAWRRELDRTLAVEGQDEHYGLEVWMPLLRERAYLPQIWNGGLERVPGWQSSSAPSRGDEDHRPLLEDDEVINALLEKRTVYEDALFFETNLTNTLDGLRMLIEVELGR
jgi:hypothetical protein